MTNVKIISLACLMVVLTTLLIVAATASGSGPVTVYGDEYVTRYFQRDQVMDIDIQISEADWDEMMANAAREEAHTATVIVNGDVYPLVTIRPKGNSSLSSVARSDSNRYSFKINFDALVQHQTMAGLTQLNLNNCFSDPSYMREYLSYQIYEGMGVNVPAFAYAAVHVNGEYFGLYLTVESILEPYLERNMGDITGDLFKSVGNTLQYNGSDPAGYSGLEVKSTLKNADWSRLIRMLEVLNNGGDVARYLDVDAALRYIAVTTALANWDSYQGNFAHNYYLYGQDGVFTILPWDLNMSFGGFGFGGNASSLYIDEPTQGALAERPLIARLLENEAYLETYHGYLEQIATQYLTSDYLEAETSQLFGLISEYVRTDPTAFYTYEQFETSISGTTVGGAMGDENQAQAGAEPQGEPAGQGFRMGGVRGFGSNVPGILEIATTMSESIQKQLQGELPSTNSGNGMGLARGGMANPGGQRPEANAEPPAGDRGVRQPGGMVLPEGLDMAAVEALRQEIVQAGGLTDELRERAGELGIPENMLEMLARVGGGRMPGGMGAEGDGGGLPPFGERPEAGVGGRLAGGVGGQQTGPVDRTALATLLVSAAAAIAGIVAVSFFTRRRHVAA